MILYPTSLLFRVVRSIQRGLEDLKAGKQVPHKEAVDMSEYEDITGLARWAEIENRFQHGHGH